MTQQPYESEALLQRLLATHPSVLAGDQFNIAEPRRWLLISREAGVPWRIRREVVGQMLDYAANASSIGLRAK